MCASACVKHGWWEAAVQNRGLSSGPWGDLGGGMRVVGGRFRRERMSVHLRLTRVVVWQKPAQRCKAIIPQLKIKIKNTCFLKVHMVKLSKTCLWKNRLLRDTPWQSAQKGANTPRMSCHIPECHPAAPPHPAAPYVYNCIIHASDIHSCIFRVGNILFSVETQTTEERTQLYHAEIDALYKDLTAKGKVLILSSEFGVGFCLPSFYPCCLWFFCPLSLESYIYGWNQL